MLIRRCQRSLGCITHSTVIYIGRSNLTVEFLLVIHKVLGAARIREKSAAISEGRKCVIPRLYTSALHAYDGLESSLTRKEGVSTESLKVTSTLSDTANVHHGAESDVDTLATEFLAHGDTAGTDELAVPSEMRLGESVKVIGAGGAFGERRHSRSCGVDASGEDRVEVPETDAEGSILQAKTGEVVLGQSTNIADARA